MTHRRMKPPTARRRYGVLVGRVRDGQEKPSGASPHYEVWIDAGGANYRVAVNVRSVDGSDVLAYFDPDFQQATKLNLPARAEGPQGFTPLSTGPGGEGLDYLRDHLFPLDAMQPIPPAGSSISLKNLLDGQIERAKADPRAVAIAVGESFADQGSDETFGFSPEQGVHDIHMMQGNRGSFASDNRVNGDGALFVRYAGGETIALFARFSVQDIETNDQAGAPLEPATEGFSS